MPNITLPDGKKLDFPKSITGLKIAETISKSLSKQILRVLNMDETSLKTIGIEARKNATQRFNVEKMCFSTYSEYKRLLN